MALVSSRTKEKNAFKGFEPFQPSVFKPFQNVDLALEKCFSHGGVEQWTLHPPQGQKTRVRILPRNKVFG
jgi:hypothetical protein